MKQLCTPSNHSLPPHKSAETSALASAELAISYNSDQLHHTIVIPPSSLYPHPHTVNVSIGDYPYDTDEHSPNERGVNMLLLDYHPLPPEPAYERGWQVAIVNDRFFNPKGPFAKLERDEYQKLGVTVRDTRSIEHLRLPLPQIVWDAIKILESRTFLSAYENDHPLLKNISGPDTTIAPSAREFAHRLRTRVVPDLRQLGSSFSPYFKIGREL
ncbi:MAG: hypothetical protein WAZ18_07010 [Alphaproteobacteria bacterium]